MSPSPNSSAPEHGAIRTDLQASADVQWQGRGARTVPKSEPRGDGHTEPAKNVILV
ncbi:hypothetical protein [uncultured Bifidobacterium sp.]|uniref:hypothetical protein n=1 Tax=uncultured Bifidobacterium sp. TaxID=165187 RepID=UPI0028DB4573|nr:hypothetical protein [uncultured Bifidobacterium sp.]